MKLAMFLDVDGVLTAEPINLQLARMLGVEKNLVEVEQQYAMSKIDNDEFNRQFIPLFRGKGFTEQFVREKFADVRMRINYEELLTLGIDTYIVSSGPSYFIEILAQKFSIPHRRVLCSRYVFDNDGIISNCIAPVSGQGKGDFVHACTRGYDLTIGIGDKPEQDAAFLSHCDVRILMGEWRLGYVSVREIEPLVGLVRKIQQSTVNTDQESAQVNKEHEAGVERLLRESPYNKNVFIMTPFKNEARYRELIRTIKDELDKLGFKGWIASDRNLSPQLWENVQCFLLGCKYGVAILTQQQPEDKTAIAEAIYNPNVSIEIGYMLSRGKSILLLKDRGLRSMPRDMMGALYGDFDLDQVDSSIPTVIKKWAQEIQQDS